MLSLISTPIGNLKDISVRALQNIEECDYVLAEDTRHSRKLLNHFEIKQTLKSYHKFNEAAREEEVIKDLREGKTIGLISDAGTPGISDPGERLVRRCVAEGIRVSGIPGPCALILALVTSGFSTARFQFVGFLPKKKGKETLLKELLAYPGTSIAYESPHRLVGSLKKIASLDPDRSLVVARELTKKFEEIARGTAPELIAHFEAKGVKGEIVLLIGTSS